MDLQLTPRALQLLAAIAGVSTYIFHFHKGEHHLFPQRYFKGLLAIYTGLILALKYSDPTSSTSAAIRTTTLLSTIYIGALTTSLLSYRYFLNPLNKFPGPPLAALTSFAHASRLLLSKDQHLQLYTHHKIHGSKIIRYGPNDISVSHADAVRVALGPGSNCVKAPWYEYEHPSYSLHSVRERKLHDPRRRIWSPAFSDKALRGYEERVVRYNECLVRQIEAVDGKPFNISKWFNFWSFDVMGDLAFGQSFNMLESAKSHWATDLLSASQEGAAFNFPPWFVRVLFATPGLRNPYYRFLAFCAEQINNRMEVQGKQANPDITHFLIEHYLSARENDPETEEAELLKLHLDSKIIIVAGSDTTASTVTFLFYHIAREPGLLGRLREEIEALSGNDRSSIDHRKIQAAPLLNGCINETLRLHPAVPSGLYRKAPAEGVYIGGEYIPGDTVMLVNFYAMGRDESNFTHANEFIPERFFSRPELIKEKDAFAPFSTGPFGCIGKNLALMEIRLLTAILVTRFEVALAPGEDGGQLLNSFDYFTVGLKPCHLVFRKRVSSASIED
ncbi:cytochrome P450 [Aspergillus californicus]